MKGFTSCRRFCWLQVNFSYGRLAVTRYGSGYDSIGSPVLVHRRREQSLVKPRHRLVNARAPERRRNTGLEVQRTVANREVQRQVSEPADIRPPNLSGSSQSQAVVTVGAKVRCIDQPL